MLFGWITSFLLPGEWIPRNHLHHPPRWLTCWGTPIFGQKLKREYEKMLVRDLDFVRSPMGKMFGLVWARQLLGEFSVGGKPMFGRGKTSLGKSALDLRFFTTSTASAITDNEWSW